MSFSTEEGATGFVRSSAEGEAIELPGWSMQLTVTAADTAGRLTVLQGQMNPGHPGPAAHIHQAHDETFILVAGRMRFRVGDDFVTSSAGETVYASRLLVHGFANPFAEPAHYVAILTPSGYEDYFRQLEAHVARTGSLPARDEMAELMAAYHTTLAAELPDKGPVPAAGRLFLALTWPDHGVGPGKDELAVPVSELHHVRWRSLAAVNLHDLAYLVGHFSSPPMDDDLVSDCCLHPLVPPSRDVVPARVPLPVR